MNLEIGFNLNINFFLINISKSFHRFKYAAKKTKSAGMIFDSPEILLIKH